MRLLGSEVRALEDDGQAPPHLIPRDIGPATVHHLARYEDGVAGLHLGGYGCGGIITITITTAPGTPVVRHVGPQVAPGDDPGGAVVRGETGEGDDEVDAGVGAAGPAGGEDGELPLVAVQGLGGAAGADVDGLGRVEPVAPRVGEVEGFAEGVEEGQLEDMVAEGRAQGNEAGQALRAGAVEGLEERRVCGGGVSSGGGGGGRWVAGSRLESVHGGLDVLV